jgi:uncharacterized membrane protein YbhN (UPF0104 family)
MPASRDFLMLFISLELVSAPAFLLAGFRKTDPRSNEGALKFFLISVLSTAIMLYGMSLIYGVTGSTRLTVIAHKLAGPAGGSSLALAAIVLVVRSPLLERFARLGEAPGAARALLETRLLVGMTAVSAASWFCECLAAYVCVRGLRLDLSLADTIVVFSLGSLAGALSFLPGGLGVAETSMTGLIRVLGDVPKAAAAAATVLIRLATLWFAVALGLVALAVEERLARSQRLPEAQAVSASGADGRTGKARPS